MSETIEVKAEPQELQLRPVQPDNGVVRVPAKTAQELRVLEVNEALLPAYQRASTLDLSAEEIGALMAHFPDDAIEVRPHDGLIYIPHIHISDRLNRVLNPGKWALMCRRHWLDGNTMYGEYVLLIRGCYVGESVGGHPYQPNNPKINYSDTLESTAGEALRRIAGKRLSCGSQVWNPEFARQWTAKYAVQVRGKWERRMTSGASETKSAPEPEKPAEPKKPTYATDATRKWMTGKLQSCIAEATEYFCKAGMLLETESLEDLPLRFVPIDNSQMNLLLRAVGSFAAGDEAQAAFPPNAEPSPGKAIEVPREQELAGTGEEWRTFPMPWGNNAGMPLEELEKKYLFGLAKNYVVEAEYNGKPKKPETIAKDRKFREMLDQAMIHYNWTKDS